LVFYMADEGLRVFDLAAGFDADMLRTRTGVTFR
jgi:hypothetical protein